MLKYFTSNPKQHVISLSMLQTDRMWSHGGVLGRTQMTHEVFFPNKQTKSKRNLYLTIALGRWRTQETPKLWDTDLQNQNHQRLMSIYKCRLLRPSQIFSSKWDIHVGAFGKALPQPFRSTRYPRNSQSSECCLVNIKLEHREWVFTRVCDLGYNRDLWINFASLQGFPF